MIPLMCAAFDNAEKQSPDCLEEEMDCRGHKESFADDGNVCILFFSGGFTDIQLS